MTPIDIKPTRRMLNLQLERLTEHARTQELISAAILYHFKVAPTAIPEMVEAYTKALEAEASLAIKTA